MQRTTTRTFLAARAVFALLMMVGTTLLNHSAMAETITYYHNDLLGSPVMATDQSGTVIWREDYEPYGKRLQNQTGAASNTQWYTGKSHDNDTGLTYMGARYYDPRFGRFLAVDPVDFTASNLHSFNRYAYANNNPYTFTDPDGNSPIDVIFFAGDAVKLVVAINSGNPAAIQSASADLAASTVGLISPIPGTGQAIKVTRAAGKVNRARIAARSGSDVVTKRPGNFRKKPVRNSWDNASGGTKPDSKQCPTCGKDVFGNPHNGEKRNGPDGWDNDHQPKWKDRDLTGMDRKQVLDEFNKDTRLRCPNCNRADN